jgi:hypothetical protein
MAFPLRCPANSRFVAASSAPRVAERTGLVSGERPACFSISVARCHTQALQPPALPRVPPYGILALRAASRLAVSLRSAGSVTSGVPSGVYRSPRKGRLVPRAPRRLRPVAAGAPDRFGTGVDLSVDRNDGGGGGILGL